MKHDREVSSRGVAEMSEETVEVLCDALDCLFNDKSRMGVANEGFCKYASLRVRKGMCVCYKMDKEWMKLSLREYFGFRKVFFPRELSDNIDWSEL